MSLELTKAIWALESELSKSASDHASMKDLPMYIS